MTKYIQTQKANFRRNTGKAMLKKVSGFVNPSCGNGGFKRLGIWVLSGLVILSFSGFYVWLITENSVKNYKIRDLRVKVEELQKENRQFEVSSAERQSAVTLNSRAGNLGMVDADKIEYIDVSEKTVAKWP